MIPRLRIGIGEPLSLSQASAHGFHLSFSVAIKLVNRQPADLDACFIPFHSKTLGGERLCHTLAAKKGRIPHK